MCIQPRTSLADLDFVPGSAAGPGMTFGKLFPFTVRCFHLLSHYQPFLSPAMLCPERYLPARGDSIRLHITSHHPKRCVNSNSSEHQQGLHPASMSLAWGVPWDGLEIVLLSSSESWRPWWGEEVLQEAWGNNTNDGSELSSLKIQLLEVANQPKHPR